ncbi:hypothetical protein TNCT_486771 [Trichonephila clavata]|uniref:Uncharacterized protein n=1 Tax=Trichonephila clavata TaxID=2740835 RepID=A0A8X6L8Q6_TRICU|nr:hypothetical protein TNCT_486771 [Trichonephila clavata]
MRLRLKEELADQNSFLVLHLVQLEADPQHAVSDRLRLIVDPVDLQAVRMRKTKRGDLPRRSSYPASYKTGKKHRDADTFSRNPVEEETETTDKCLAVATSMNLATDQKKNPAPE